MIVKQRKIETCRNASVMCSALVVTCF